MTLATGTQLGPYEILSPIGAGGMGEVYRAKDTRLDREVAIKVLSAQLSKSDELRQRFEREAKAISNLTHPNICTLYDVGRQDGVDYLVMEYLEGETLSERLGKSSLPIEDVLRIGAEIAAALDKAHRAGIVHRDLKPSNIMLTQSGAKLLDFGLAKSMTGAGLSSEPDAVTISEPLTGRGTIVGTFQYMAPEQLEGKEADARTDIFAFGAVLYEMATRKRAFEGSSRASLIASIMSAQPRAISELQPMTPPALERLVRKCLAKSPDDRWQSAADLADELRWVSGGGSQIGMPAQVSARRKNRERFAFRTSVVLAVAVVALGVAYYRSASVPPTMLTAAVRPPKDARFVFAGDSGGPAVISPDGERIVFTGRCEDGINRLWLRRLDTGATQVLPGTDNAHLPFWSPDSTSVAFFAHEQLKRTSLAGGLPLTLCDAPIGKGGTWPRGGHILFAPDFRAGIFRVSESGGTPTPVTSVGEGDYTTHRFPIDLGDGKHFLYFAGNHDLSRRGNDGIFFASLDGSVNKLVIKTRGNAAYASVHLLYLRNETLMAQPFDTRHGELTGAPIPIAYNVQYDEGTWRGVFSASENGVLIYQTGLAQTGVTLTWFDRSGKNLGSLGNRTLFIQLRISPDGTRVVSDEGDPADIWVVDLSREVRTRITTDPRDEGRPVWSPDGTKIVYVSRNRPDKRRLVYMQSSDGSGVAELLYDHSEELDILDWSPDGKFLMLAVLHENNQGEDIELLSLDGGKKLIPFVATRFDEHGGRFSPDGRWIAYRSDESGRYEVYVVPFCSELTSQGALAPCDRTGRVQISTAGGVRPLWSRDGTTLYYQTLDRTIMAVPVDTTGEDFAMDAAEPLFTPATAPDTIRAGFAWDVAPDGERFLIRTFAAGDATPLTLVLNWTRMLENQ